MIDLSVVIVSWNVRDLLRACLRSVSRSWGTDPVGLEVLVVDNASTDGSAAMVRAEFPATVLIENSVNTGFTVGNNQAIACARGRYVLLLNPDTEVLSDALRAMVACLDSHLDIGALGPRLLNADRTVQSSRRRFPTFRTALVESTVLQQWWPDNAILRRFYVQDRSDAEFQDVDWVVGASMLARHEAIEEIGGLDESFFMYSEEMDWCYRLKQAGWRVAYMPQAQVVHYGGESSRQVAAAQHIHFQRSKIRYFRKHWGSGYAALLRGFLFLNYGYQLVVEGLKWLVGHKRALRAERLRAYSQVLRSGL
jgi:N-acetylglucosaminyl-diphospho-decaprenol L-rhamnosyltransferase